MFTSKLRITGLLCSSGQRIPLTKGQWYEKHISMVSCQKDPTRHAYAWQIGPFWQDTLDLCHGVIIVTSSLNELAFNFLPWSIVTISNITEVIMKYLPLPWPSIFRPLWRPNMLLCFGSCWWYGFDCRILGRRGPQYICKEVNPLWPAALLLTWFNFNHSMDK